MWSDRVNLKKAKLWHQNVKIRMSCSESLNQISYVKYYYRGEIFTSVHLSVFLIWVTICKFPNHLNYSISWWVINIWWKKKLRAAHSCVNIQALPLCCSKSNVWSTLRIRAQCDRCYIYQNNPESARDRRAFTRINWCTLMLVVPDV